MKKLGLTFVCALLPFTALAQHASTRKCNALVSIDKDLYLADSGGKILNRFTSDGQVKYLATLSPGGDKVAYVNSQQGVKTYEVANNEGQVGSFSVYSSKQSNNASIADGPLQALSWNAKELLRLKKFAGKDYWSYEFRRIPNDLSPPAPLVDSPVMEDNCVMKGQGGPLACIDTRGAITLGHGVNNNGQAIFSVSGYEGSPEESFTLNVGESATTNGTKILYKVTLMGIGKNGISLRVTPPNGNWVQAYLTNGDYIGSPPPYDGVYGFFVTTLGGKSGSVRVDVIKNDSPQNPFGQALAWQPKGQGLIFIQYTNTQSFLDLIQPGRGHVSGHPAGGQGPQWHLAAQAPISLPGNAQSMRFLTPSLVLLNTGDYRGHQYSEVPINITNGQNNGKPSLTIGTVTPLPATIAVTMNGKSSQASVLDWSCQSNH